jgi:enoyl-CoA hydratase/carnithine racemase
VNRYENIAETSHDLLREQPSPGVRVLTLNRPVTRNALSVSMISALHQALKDVAEDATVSAIVLASNGQSFSSGHDLKELTAHRTDSDGGRAFFEQAMTNCSTMMQAIVACPKPVIAAVEGTATAAGCQLVASCDLAVASSAAAFATPGVNIGLFCSTPMVALSRAVPRKRAMEMLLLGGPISAEKAAEFGLINRVVPPGDALATAMDWAKTIASKSKMTVAVGKEAFYRQIEMPLTEAYGYAAKIMVENMLRNDANEGICAFLEKRSPTWKDS